MSFSFRSVFLLLGSAGVLSVGDASAQRLSQQGTVSQAVNETEITIAYSRPVARGRTLFGGIIAWDRIWNPGADTATAITFSTPVTVAGEAVPAGTYTIWLQPGRARWTFILSRAHGIFHDPYPGESQDALRLRVATTTAAHMEAMAFYFPVVGPRQTTLRFHWGTTALDLPITVP